jgi:hypothetical protein
MKDSSFSSLSKIQGTMHKAFIGYYRTKDFIKALRRCKTSAEERALLAKESLSIRNALKNPKTTSDHRYHSIGKLMVMQLLENPVLFGQVECMKLAASFRKSTGKPRLNHKRLGYLGTSMLVDGEQCTLPLICNTIKSDFLSNDPPVMAMAANALALLSNSEEICQEMLPQILELLGSRTLHPEVRKRLAACASHMVHVVPELGELFVTARGNRQVLAEELDILLVDRTEGSMMSFCDLMFALLKNKVVGDFVREESKTRILPTLLRLLDTIRKSAPPEYDIAGIPDPFLQVKLIKLITQIAKGDQVAAEVVSSTLIEIQSATNLGNIIEQNISLVLLLECCQSILSIPAPQSAQASAARKLLELLGMSNQLDATMRYVILNVICTIKNTLLDKALVMHRSQILGFLKDSGELDWSLKSKVILLALVNLTKENYKQILTQVNEVLACSLGSGDKIVIINAILAQLRNIELQDGQWFGEFISDLFNSSQAEKIGFKTNSEGGEDTWWFVVSEFIDLIDKNFYDPSDVSLLAGNNQFLLAIDLWIKGESLIQRDLSVLTEVILRLGSSKLAGYYISAIGKASLRFSEAVESNLNILHEIAVHGPLDVIERALEMAIVVQNAPTETHDLVAKRESDHVLVREIIY